MNKKRIMTISLFIVLVLCSISISLFTLYSQSIRLDESQSLWVATKSIPALLEFTAQDVHVPLYGLLLHFWTQIYGTDIFVARTLSLFFFIISLPVLYVLTRESSNVKVAMLTVALFSLSPFVMWFSNEARMYTLFTLVTTVNHLFFLRVLRSNGSSGKFGYFLSTLFGFYTHYFFLFLLATQAFYILFQWFMKVYKDEDFGKVSFLSLVRKYKRIPFVLLGLVAAAFVFFIPWLAYVFQAGSASNTQPLISAPTTYNIFLTLINFLFGFQDQGTQAFIIALWPLTIILLFLLFTKSKKAPLSDAQYFLLVTFMPIGLVFLASFFRPIFLSRYLILVTPTLFFIVAWSLMSHSRKMSKVLVTGFLLLMFTFSMYQNSSAATPVKENYNGAAAYLSGYTSPKDIVAVSAPFTVYPIEYSYTGRARIVTIPEWNRYVSGSIPPFSQQKLEEQIQGYKQRYVKIHLVLSYDQGYEKNIREYMDNNFELIQAVDFSPGLEVRTYILRYDVTP